MITDIKQDLCLICGEVSPMGQGIIAYITHPCYTTTYTYKSLTKGMVNKWARNLNGIDDMASFKSLLIFPHFKKYWKYDQEARDKLFTLSALGYSFKEHPIDEILYSHSRDYEIKAMKRIRAWIEIEEEFIER